MDMGRIRVAEILLTGQVWDYGITYVTRVVTELISY